MFMFLKRTFRTSVIIVICIIAINSLLWVGQQDYKEAHHRQERLENYDVMINNANNGNHHLNRSFLSGDNFDNK